MKQLSIIAILMSISAICFGQAAPQELMDTIAITSPTHLKTMPGLVDEAKALSARREELKPILDKYQEIIEQVNQVQSLLVAEKNNNEKILLVLSSYVDPEKIAGLTSDQKAILVKK